MPEGYFEEKYFIIVRGKINLGKMSISPDTFF